MKRKKRRWGKRKQEGEIQIGLVGVRQREKDEQLTEKRGRETKMKRRRKTETQNKKCEEIRQMRDRKKGCRKRRKD